MTVDLSSATTNGSSGDTNRNLRNRSTGVPLDIEKVNFVAVGMRRKASPGPPERDMALRVEGGPHESEHAGCLAIMLSGPIGLHGHVLFGMDERQHPVPLGRGSGFIGRGAVT